MLLGGESVSCTALSRSSCEQHEKGVSNPMSCLLNPVLGSRSMPRRPLLAQATALREERRIAEIRVVLPGGLHLDICASGSNEGAQASRVVQLAFFSLVRIENWLFGHKGLHVCSCGRISPSAGVVPSHTWKTDGIGPVRNAREDGCSPEGMVRGRGAGFLVRDIRRKSRSGSARCARSIAFRGLTDTRPVGSRQRSNLDAHSAQSQ